MCSNSNPTCQDHSDRWNMLGLRNIMCSNNNPTCLDHSDRGNMLGLRNIMCSNMPGPLRWMEHVKTRLFISKKNWHEVCAGETVISGIRYLSKNLVQSINPAFPCLISSKPVLNNRTTTKDCTRQPKYCIKTLHQHNDNNNFRSFNLWY